MLQFLSSLTTCLRVIHNISPCGLVVVFSFFWNDHKPRGSLWETEKKKYAKKCIYFVVGATSTPWLTCGNGEFLSSKQWFVIFKSPTPPPHPSPTPQEISTWKSLTVPYVLRLPWSVIVKQYFCITQLHLLILYAPFLFFFFIMHAHIVAFIQVLHTLHCSHYTEGP